MLTRGWFILTLAHDPTRKPLHTFRDHARPGLNSRFWTIPAAQLTRNRAPIVPYSQAGISMHPIVAFLLDALALYAAIGALIALSFVTYGVTRVQPASVSPGARILILPGAA